MEYIILLLPVIWATTATIIGLLLYKSSKAFFSNELKNGATSKRIRLVGSVVIAAAAFLGMKISTPSASLDLQDEDEIQLNKSEMNQLVKNFKKLDRALMEGMGCYSAIDSSYCLLKLEEAWRLSKEISLEVSILNEDNSSSGNSQKGNN